MSLLRYMSSCVCHDLPTLVRIGDVGTTEEEKERERVVMEALTLPSLRSSTSLSSSSCPRSPFSRPLLRHTHKKHYDIHKPQEVEPKQAADAVRSEFDCVFSFLSCF